MLSWVRDWLVLSTLVIMGLGMVFVLWVVWPLLPARVPAAALASFDLEAIGAILLLLVMFVGWGKLMCLK
jgi:hypothetical protein